MILAMMMRKAPIPSSFAATVSDIIVKNAVRWILATDVVSIHALIVQHFLHVTDAKVRAFVKTAK